MNLHPLSIPLRAVPRAASVGSTLFFVALVGGSTGFLPGPLSALPFALSLALAGALAGIVWEALYVRRFSYALSADTFDITSGVVSRRNREIPYRRVQNVDISRGVVSRALGLAAIDLETAGGGETEASLRYVSYDEAKRLQREIQRRKRGAADEGEEAPTEVPAQQVFELPLEHLLVLSLVSLDPRPLFPVLFLVVPATFPFVGQFPGASAMVAGGLWTVGLAVVSWLASGVLTFTRFFDFRLVRSGDDLQYERGLLRRFDGSIPLSKIQTVAVRENVLMRRLGFGALSVETAGYTPGQAPSGGSEAAIPLAPREQVFSIARSVDDFAFGSLAFTRPPKRARRRYAMRYAIAVGLATAILSVIDRFTGLVDYWYLALALLALVPVAAHYKWKHRGYHLGEAHVVTRNGFWRRSIDVVPYTRLQTVHDEQTVFQRRWGLATVVVDTAGSVSLTQRGPRAVDIAAGDAEELRETVYRRFQRTRRT